MNMTSLLELDARLSNRMRVAEKPGALRNIAIVLAHSGDSWFWGAALILLWFFGDPAWREWYVVEFVGISLLAVLVMGIKFLEKFAVSTDAQDTLMLGAAFAIASAALIGFSALIRDE